MKLLKSAVSFAAIAGVFYLLFAYLGDFQVRQSIVLGIVAAWLAWNLAHAAPQPSGIFTPYYVTVWPNWFQLLTDFKLISAPEDWESIQNSLKDIPATEYRVLRSGIYFTVLQQTEDLQRALIYRNDHRSFVSEIDFEEWMDPIESPQRKRISPLITGSDISFFTRFDVGGYSLGIRGPLAWWEKVKSNCPAAVSEQEHDHLTGQVKLVLATIPYGEFNMYWEPANAQKTYNEAVWSAEMKTRADRRSKFGWTEVEHPHNPELSIDFPESIEHKYFTVNHRSI